MEINASKSSLRIPSRSEDNRVCASSVLLCSSESGFDTHGASLLILFPFGWVRAVDVRRVVISYTPLTMSNVRTPSSRNLIAIVKTHGHTQPERHLSSSASLRLSAFSAASFPALYALSVFSFFSSLSIVGLFACLPYQYRILYTRCPPKVKRLLSFILRFFFNHFAD